MDKTGRYTGLTPDFAPRETPEDSNSGSADGSAPKPIDIADREYPIAGKSLQAIALRLCHMQEDLMTAKEWKGRCAARYIERAGVTTEHAQELADACFENQDGGLFHLCCEHVSPEDCADEDMSYWASDEG